MCDRDADGVCYCTAGCVCGHCLAEEWGLDEDAQSLSSLSSWSSGSGSESDQDGGEQDGGEVDGDEVDEGDVDGCDGQDLMGVLSAAEREAVRAEAEREIVEAEMQAEAEWEFIERENDGR